MPQSYKKSFRINEKTTAKKCAKLNIPVVNLITQYVKVYNFELFGFLAIITVHNEKLLCAEPGKCPLV